MLILSQIRLDNTRGKTVECVEVYSQDDPDIGYELK